MPSAGRCQARLCPHRCPPFPAKDGGPDEAAVQGPARSAGARPCSHGVGVSWNPRRWAVGGPERAPDQADQADQPSCRVPVERAQDGLPASRVSELASWSGTRVRGEGPSPVIWNTAPLRLPATLTPNRGPKGTEPGLGPRAPPTPQGDEAHPPQGRPGVPRAAADCCSAGTDPQQREQGGGPATKTEK